MRSFETLKQYPPYPIPCHKQYQARFLRPGLLAFAFLLRAMATACFCDLTTGPPLPLCMVPAFHSCMAPAMAFSPFVIGLAFLPLVIFPGMVDRADCLSFPCRQGLDSLQLPE